MHLDEITVVVGALGSITLTLILPPLLHNTVRKPGRLRRVGHWAMSAFWTVILVSHQLSSFVFRNDNCPAFGVTLSYWLCWGLPNGQQATEQTPKVSVFQPRSVMQQFPKPGG